MVFEKAIGITSRMEGVSAERTAAFPQQGRKESTPVFLRSRPSGHMTTRFAGVGLATWDFGHVLPNCVRRTERLSDRAFGLFSE